jgi:hypothetical protein
MAIMPNTKTRISPTNMVLLLEISIKYKLMGKRGPKPKKTDFVHKKRTEIETLRRKGLNWWEIYIELFTTAIESEKPAFKTFKKEVFKWNRKKTPKPKTLKPIQELIPEARPTAQITRKKTNFFN